MWTGFVKISKSTIQFPPFYSSSIPPPFHRHCPHRHRMPPVSSFSQSSPLLQCQRPFKEKPKICKMLRNTKKLCKTLRNTKKLCKTFRIAKKLCKMLGISEELCKMLPVSKKSCKTSENINKLYKICKKKKFCTKYVRTYATLFLIE